jgi:Ca-activated chloride channel family protein
MADRLSHVHNKEERVAMRPFYLVLLFGLFWLNSLGQTAQTVPPKQPQADETVSEDEVVRVDTTLVGVPVTVLDHEGRFVADLKQEDFHVYEDGVEQQIAYFAPVEAHVTVLLLFDHFVKNYHQIATTFAAQLRTGDKVIVARFGDVKYETLTKVADGETGVQPEPHRVKWHFGTSVHDAVDAAIRRMNSIQGRKAIVLFSDGMLRGIEEITVALPSGRLLADKETKPRERASVQSTLNEAEESDAPFYVLQPDIVSDEVRTGRLTPGKRYDEVMRIFLARAHDDYKIADAYLHALAEKSGGRLFQVKVNGPIHPADKSDYLTQPFTQISAELRQQYSLGYYPKQPAQPNERHEIKVRVAKPDVVVRARTNYVAAPAKP